MLIMCYFHDKKHQLDPLQHLGNMQQRIRALDVSEFSCICNSLASANPKGAQNLLRAFTESYKTTDPNHQSALVLLAAKCYMEQKFTYANPTVVE